MSPRALAKASFFCSACKVSVIIENDDDQTYERKGLTPTDWDRLRTVAWHNSQPSHLIAAGISRRLSNASKPAVQVSLFHRDVGVGTKPERVAPAGNGKGAGRG
jgi:hypothetical protein